MPELRDNVTMSTAVMKRVWGGGVVWWSMLFPVLMKFMEYSKCFWIPYVNLT